MTKPASIAGSAEINWAQELSELAKKRSKVDEIIKRQAGTSDSYEVALAAGIKPYDVHHTRIISGEKILRPDSEPQIRLDPQEATASPVSLERTEPIINLS